MSRSVRIPWSGGVVTGRWRRPRTPIRPAVLLAHGAGTDQDHHSIVRLREGLAVAGHPVLTFNYPYTEAGRGRPDRQATLLDCHRAAVDWLTGRFDRILLAGRSMGGRMSTYLAAEGVPMEGLILYAYPLHPAGRPERLRVEHLPDITVPMLFFTGTRDALAQPALVDRWLDSLPGATVVRIEDADHSFRVPKRTGTTYEAVVDGIVARSVDWMATI